MTFKKGKGLDGKMKVIRGFINMWLKDETLYCNTCGTKYTGVRGKWVCDSKRCEEPQIGRNMDHAFGIMKQNKMMKDEVMGSETGASNEGAFRYAVSMPVSLLKDLEALFSSQYQEELFDNVYTLRRFMREFPQFSMARRV